ncbi:MAG TPA: hypothetical protein VLY24_13470 [Bryobacteraceae bacterium]|nr:hypothetical protein [Bryobacteraceae bacterium]
MKILADLAFQRASPVHAQPVHSVRDVIQVSIGGALTSGICDFVKLAAVLPHDAREQQHWAGG